MERPPDSTKSPETFPFPSSRREISLAFETRDLDFTLEELQVFLLGYVLVGKEGSGKKGKRRRRRRNNWQEGEEEGLTFPKVEPPLV